MLFIIVFVSFKGDKLVKKWYFYNKQVDTPCKVQSKEKNKANKACSVLSTPCAAPKHGGCVSQSPGTPPRAG